ncbi:serine/threonine-protein kinase [Mycolicibacterium elephantis]|uniref:non-specific serine/threonine protein kinase n=1 Tax=Mycolicibacterium elephantis TaxID=81858 RepID=A0A0M2Z9C0_9MYCO|nr:serine/threonine-protein kinase [Mycolicibacterium elephantis]KKW62246.1 protein kinase [Mycolicibacterium elephantis]OBA65154.1 protein kinase [Mycolicibacterium elephantis]ORA69222.1 serine/threonine protein kinase [Mycolicibacterium elephantis]
MLAPGDRFERYVVDAVLGHGGYATVYRVHDAAAPDRVAALKILDEQHRHQAQVARLRREFELARGLDHPHIVKVFERGAGWLTMEVVDDAVTTLVDRDARLAALGQIADALDYTHNRAVVHCDVKPANIRVAALRAVLIDFGVAHSMTDDIGRRPTEAEMSLPYAAPELITGHAPVSATDEYALACTTVELLTGAPPFTDDSRMGLIRAHLHQQPPRWSRQFSWLPRVFDSILAKALAKDPADRYRSCREFVSLVTRALR